MNLFVCFGVSATFNGCLRHFSFLSPSSVIFAFLFWNIFGVSTSVLPKSASRRRFFFVDGFLEHAERDFIRRRKQKQEQNKPIGI